MAVSNPATANTPVKSNVRHSPSTPLLGHMWVYEDGTMPKTGLVIGIDFGTTHSGVSWALNAGTRNVHLIENWPDPQARNRTSHKVPSAVTYDATRPSKLCQWGFPAIRRQGNFRNESEVFTWFKLLLEKPRHVPDSAGESESELATLQRLLEKYGKTADEVTVDYLRCIWTYTKEYLKRYLLSNFQDTYSVKVILTIPAVWSPPTVKKVKELAIQAGLPADTVLLPEPEAAAVAVLGAATQRAQLKVGDVITVCDAGGGTCDLITYEILKLDPYLRVKECVMGEGGFCGSVYIDKAFETYIRNLVGPRQYDIIDTRDKKQMMSDFELGVKPSFQYNLRQNARLIVDLRGVKDNINKGIEDETIVLKPKDLKKVFHPTCHMVQELVEKQLKGILGDLKVKAVLLVGGFGESAYLFDQLEATVGRRGSRLLKGEGAWSAVCRGATYWGLERTMIASRKSRYSYGIIKTPAFDPRERQQEEIVWDDADSIWRDNDQIQWVLRKGDEIMDGRTVEVQEVRTVEDIGFFDFGSRRFYDVFLYCGSDDIPERCTDDVKPLGYLPWEVDLKRIRWHEKHTEAGRRTRKFKYTLELKLGPAIMELGSIYRGKRVGMVELPYEQEEENPGVEFKWVRPQLPLRRKLSLWP